MAETNLSFAKVVSTPTLNAWSQAYSAGRLFAVLSLTLSQEAGEKLNEVGKDLISTLESEFFTLENKDLESIKQAVLTTTARIPSDIKFSFVLCYLAENVLYLFTIGGGKAVLKRGEKIGTVLEGEDSTNVKSASGYVQDQDVIILQTKQFLNIISSSALASAMERNKPDDIAEDLAPHVHERAEGGAAALVLVYKEGAGIDPVVIPEPEIAKPEEEIEALDGEIPVVDIDESPVSFESETEDDEPAEIGPAIETIATPSIEDIPSMGPKPVPSVPQPSMDLPSDSLEEMSNQSPFLTDQMPKRTRLSKGFSLGFLKKLPQFSRQRKIILTIAGVLLVLILATSFLAINNKNSASDKKLFTSVYQQANSKYEEGQNLKDLNSSLSQQNLNEAKSILETNIPKFKEGTNERQQLEDLLSKVTLQTSSVSDGQSVTPQTVDKSESKILSYELNNSDANFFAQNDDNVFFLDGTGVSSIDKGNDKKSQVIKKSWKTDGGIGLFGSNVYVLDKDSGVLKFVPSDSTYTKSSYFSDSTPDLTDSVSMAIDGSIFILHKGGSIDKYTKAKKDDFTISGLDKSLSSPSKIFTDSDTDNLYILDNGNSRIVVMDKSGKFQKAYSADILKSAKDFEVIEKDKKVFVLNGDKVYQINL